MYVWEPVEEVFTYIPAGDPSEHCASGWLSLKECKVICVASAMLRRKASDSKANIVDK